MEVGKVVYFKRIALTSGPNSPHVEFKGLGYGVLLGNLPPEFKGELSRGHILRVLASIGFISFDDIIELAGKEVADTLIQRFQMKYYTKGVVPIPPKSILE